MRDDAWTWDETLYAGSAPYYGIGRMRYPAALADTFRRGLGLNGTQRLLDVGCGPGSLTLLLAPLVAEAVGVDADRGMIDEALRATDRIGLENLAWHHMRAEQLPGGLGEFDVVTFAQSFHWMDRPAVATAVHDMLTPGGACGHIDATMHRGEAGEDPLPHPRPPHDAIAGLVADYLGPVRRAGRGRLPDGTPSGEDAIFRAAGFRGPRRLQVDGGAVVERSADEIVAAVFSLSSSAPHLFGARRDAFEQDLRELLRDSAPDGVFCERRAEIAVDVWQA